MKKSTGTRIAIIGAGISGPTAGKFQIDHGFDVQVFDKARGPGGRMSTRREGALNFNHGAQFFIVHSESIAEAVEHWDEESQVGVCGCWCMGNRIENAYLSGLQPACAILESAKTRK